jgi:hypothetical protein
MVGACAASVIGIVAVGPEFAGLPTQQVRVYEGAPADSGDRFDVVMSDLGRPDTPAPPRAATPTPSASPDVTAQGTRRWNELLDLALVGGPRTKAAPRPKRTTRATTRATTRRATTRSTVSRGTRGTTPSGRRRGIFARSRYAQSLQAQNRLDPRSRRRASSSYYRSPEQSTRVYTNPLGRSSIFESSRMIRWHGSSLDRSQLNRRLRRGR